KGGSLPELKVDFAKGVSLAGGDGRTMVLGPPASANFPWVLLDSKLLRQAGILARSHGRRDAAALDTAAEAGFTRRMPAARRATLQKWFNSCLKRAPDRGAEADVFSAL